MELGRRTLIRKLSSLAAVGLGGCASLTSTPRRPDGDDPEETNGRGVPVSGPPPHDDFIITNDRDRDVVLTITATPRSGDSDIVSRELHLLGESRRSLSDVVESGTSYDVSVRTTSGENATVEWTPDHSWSTLVVTLAPETLTLDHVVPRKRDILVSNHLEHQVTVTVAARPVGDGNGFVREMALETNKTIAYPNALPHGTQFVVEVRGPSIGRASERWPAEDADSQSVHFVIQPNGIDSYRGTA